MVRAQIAAALFAVSAAMPAWAETPAPPPSRPVMEQPLSPNGIRDIQRELRSAGFYRGPIDGNWGRETEAALGAYQENHGLRVTWQLDPATVRAMGLDPQALQATSETSEQGPGAPSGQVLPRSVVQQIQQRLTRAGFSPDLPTACGVAARKTPSGTSNRRAGCSPPEISTRSPPRRSE